MPVSSLRNKAFFPGAFLLSGLLTSGAVWAQTPDTNLSQTQPGGGFSVQAIGTETATSSSNPLMSTTGAKELWGSTTAPELSLKDTTDSSAFNLDTTVDENVFNQSNFNSTDVHEAGGISTTNETWSAGLQQRTDYDTTRTSEVSNFNLAPVIARHLGLSIAPQITANPTPVDSFSLAGSALTSQYDNNIFTDYDTYAATPSYTHKFDPLNAAIFSLQAQRYQTARNNADRVDSINPAVGWQTSLSPRFTANAGIGAEANREYIFGVATSPWTWQYTFSGGLNFTGVEDTIKFATARQQFPYGNGTEGLQTSAILTESHALNEAVSLNFGANYQEAKYQAAAVGDLKSLAGGNVGATYHVLATVDVTATYQYRYETLTEESATAHDNSFMLALAYHPKPCSP